MADKQLNTDEEILKSIGELDDQVADQDSNEGEDDEDVSSQQDQGTDKETKGAKESGTGKPTKESARTSDGGKQGKKASPGPQDIVDAKGNIVARGGPERRFYEQAQAYRRQADAHARELATLKPKLEALEAANNVGKQYGLEPSEVVAAAQLLKAYKESPAETIKYLLTQAQAAGHNVGDLAGSGVTTAALKQLLAEQLKPILEERQEKQQFTQIQQEATQQYNTFVSSHPDAVIHNDVIAQLLERDENLTPEAAYWKLKTFFAERGLDFSKPISWHQEQINKGANGKGTQRRSLPSGLNVDSEDDVQDQEEVVRVDSSMDDIVRQSMREAGFKV